MLDPQPWMAGTSPAMTVWSSQALLAAGRFGYNEVYLACEHRVMASPYDPSNIFAKILRGEIPCHKIMDDEVALAFMDIMPRCEGHCLVIPKVPARTLLDIAPEDLARLITRVQAVARAAVAAMGADGLTLQQFNEEAGGQEVPHLHFHVLPRRPGVALRAPGGPMADAAVLREQAGRIAAHLEA